MSEERTLLTGTALNVVGLVAGVLAALGVQILLGHTLPPGGFVLRWPGQEAPGPARINGRAAPWREAELSIHDVRATVILDSVR